MIHILRIWNEHIACDFLYVVKNSPMFITPVCYSSLLHSRPRYDWIYETRNQCLTKIKTEQNKGINRIFEQISGRSLLEFFFTLSPLNPSKMNERKNLVFLCCHNFFCRFLHSYRFRNGVEYNWKIKMLQYRAASTQTSTEM